MRKTLLLVGLMLTGPSLPEKAVCWIDPMTGRPYLAKCDKSRKQARQPATEKIKTPPEQPVETAKKGD